MLSDEGSVKFKTLQQAYRESLEAKRKGLEDCWQAVQANAWSMKSLQGLKLYTHRLAGSAAPYGFNAISSASSELEKLILDYLDSEPRGARPEEIKALITRSFRQLTEAIDKV